MFDKICFTSLVDPGTCYVKNATVFFKSLLLEYMATPGTGNVSVAIDNYRCLTIRTGSACALKSLLLFCYENSDPAEYEKGFLECVKSL